MNLVGGFHSRIRKLQRQAVAFNMSLGLGVHLTSLADPLIPVQRTLHGTEFSLQPTPMPHILRDVLPIFGQRQRNKPGIPAAADGQADKLAAARLEGNRGARGTAR